MPNAQILVVDDNPINLKLISDVLACAGYNVVQAQDAEGGLVIVKTSPPELILMDIALPGMDGLELTRKLKADPATRRIIVIALTAFAMKGDEDKALAAGCNGYLSKPINTRTFPEQVGQWLKIARE